MLSILHARHHLTSHICEAPPHLTRLHTRLLFAHAKTRPRKSYGSCSFCLSYVSHTKTNAPPCTGSDIGQTPAKQSDSRMLSTPHTPTRPPANHKALSLHHRVVISPTSTMSHPWTNRPMHELAANVGGKKFRPAVPWHGNTQEYIRSNVLSSNHRLLF